MTTLRRSRRCAAARLGLVQLLLQLGGAACNGMQQVQQVSTRMLPLAGKRLLLTGHRSSTAPRLGLRLAERGARPIVMPTVVLEPCADVAFAPLDDALLRLLDYDVVVLPFPDAVRALADRMNVVVGFNPKLTAQVLGSVRLATTGSQAGLVKELLGVSPSVLPADPSLAGLATALESLSLARPGAKVLCLLPVYAGVAEPPAVASFVAQLEATGASVTRVAACIVTRPSLDSCRVELGLLRDGAIDGVVFTSGAEVEGLWQLLEEARGGAAGGGPVLGASGRAIALDWGALLPARTVAVACHGADAMMGAEVWGLETDVGSPLGVVEEIIGGLEARLGVELLSPGGLIL